MMHQLRIAADEMCREATRMDQVQAATFARSTDKQPTAYCASTRFQSQSMLYSGYETGGVPLSMKV